MRKSDHDYAKARHLRRQQTLPEGLVWRKLRGRRTGLKSRRQHPVGHFVLDFYCAQAKLGIEIDGKAHDMGKRSEIDCARDENSCELGLKIIRFSAPAVLQNPTAVAETILAVCKQRID
ncbi:endonuclease domain-containing protein [Aurantiacibacter gangjinensis]|uniref:DUF559 domain-containing protein n=1 Tax=Aurantiacibacter gangjinensis TaxID=502682 RepID=A0A0G9MQZ6_9SPHN|nr:DUF559 domain-containing protein [Aurantiacibacter gangjinensis]KLE31733.1 hypothetical protein AAW01_09495 [Aurantiacibacter gangjinensis]